MDQKTRKLMPMHKAQYPRDNVERLYVLKKGWRGLASIQGRIDSSLFFKTT